MSGTLLHQNTAPRPGHFEFQSTVTGTAATGHIKGVASSTSLARRNPTPGKTAAETKDEPRLIVFTQSAQASMQAQAPLPLAGGVDHMGAMVIPDAAIGMVTDWSLSEDGNTLNYEGDLNPAHPSYALYMSMLDPTSLFHTPLKVSIGGSIPTGAVKTVHLNGNPLGPLVQQVDDVKLDHLLVCKADAACNQDTTFEGAAAPAEADWLEIIGQAAAQMIDPEAVTMATDSGIAPVEAMPDTDAGVADANAGLGIDIDAVREMVRDALRQRYQVELTEKSPYISIQGLYVDEGNARKGTAHYEVWTPGGNEAQYIVSWELNAEGTDVTLGGSPVEVIVKELLVTPDGKPALPVGQANHADGLYALTDAETLEFMSDVTGQAAAVETGAWKNPTAKQRKTMPDNCFLYVDGDLKLFPVYEVGEDGKRGKVNARALGAATRRLQDVKGHGAHTADQIRKTVEGKLRKLYKEIGKPLPSSLAGQANEGGSTMSNLLKTIADAFGQAAAAEDGGEIPVPVVAPEATGQAAEATTPEYVTVAQCQEMIKAATDPIGQSLTTISETLVEMAKAAKPKDDEKAEAKPDDEAAEGEQCEQATATETPAEEAAPEAEVAAQAGAPSVDPEFASVVAQAIGTIGDKVDALVDRLGALEGRGKPTGQSQALPAAQASVPPVAAPAAPKGDLFDRMESEAYRILKAG